MMKQYKVVTVIESPVSTRYFNPGCEGLVDCNSKQIRIGGSWFDYTEDRSAGWRVVANDESEKRMHLLAEMIIDTFLSDVYFSRLITAFAVSEALALKWMVDAGIFHRLNTHGGWVVEKHFG